VTAGAHCVGCGKPSTECAGCQWEYDPPRFCPRCGLRLAVSVTPNGWHARCKSHGDLAPS
jgi:hypothetical protein